MTVLFDFVTAVRFISPSLVQSSFLLLGLRKKYDKSVIEVFNPFQVISGPDSKKRKNYRRKAYKEKEEQKKIFKKKKTTKKKMKERRKEKRKKIKQGRIHSYPSREQVGSGSV